MSAFSVSTMNVIAYRSNGLDEVTGLPVERGHHHHRSPRGMGGTSDPAKDSPANCLYVHPRIHEEIESNRERALHNGWLVRQGADPERVPVLLADSHWYVLHRDGTKTMLDLSATLA